MPVFNCKSRCGAQEPLSCACLSAERSRDGLGRLTLRKSNLYENDKKWVFLVVRDMALIGFVAFLVLCVFFHWFYQPIKYWSWYQFWGVQSEHKKSSPLRWVMPWNPIQISQGTLKGTCPKAVVAGSDSKAGIKPLALCEPGPKTHQFLCNFVVYLKMVVVLWFTQIHAVGTSCVRSLTRVNCMLRTTSLWRIAAETSVLKILQLCQLYIVLCMYICVRIDILTEAYWYWWSDVCIYMRYKLGHSVYLILSYLAAWN